jgi:hypothetical protein
VNPSSGADHGAPADRGVLTAADAHYFPGLLGLHASVQASGAYPVLCYDLGLTDEQRAEATRCANLQVLELPPDPLIEELRQAARGDPAPQKPGKRTWAIWICPLLIRAAPLHDVVWLDCDMLVLRGLEELFAMLDDGPVFTPETHAPALTPNDPELYRLLPIARSFDPGQPTVNGGVSAWRRGRDDHALDAYIRPVAAVEPQLCCPTGDRLVGPGCPDLGDPGARLAASRTRLSRLEPSDRPHGRPRRDVDLGRWPYSDAFKRLYPRS